MPSNSWTTLTVDCSDAELLGALTGAAPLGGHRSDGDGWSQLRNPEGGIGLNIQAEDAYEPPVWPEQPDTRRR